jgi:hypothetical protein
VYVSIQIAPAAALPGGRAATSVCIHSPHLTFEKIISILKPIIEFTKIGHKKTIVIKNRVFENDGRNYMVAQHN